MDMNFEKDIDLDFKKWDEMPRKPQDMTRYPNYYIIDENQTVKWNREEVKKNNELYDKKVQELNFERNKFRDSIHEKIYKYIKDLLNDKITIKQAILIYNYAYDQGHPGGWHDVCCCIDELVDFVYNFMKYENVE